MWCAEVDFDVGIDFTVEGEFKTSERDGILLSTSSTTEDVGLTLELHDGRVSRPVNIGIVLLICCGSCSYMDFGDDYIHAV